MLIFNILRKYDFIERKKYWSWRIKIKIKGIRWKVNINWIKFGKKKTINSLNLIFNFKVK